MCEHGIHYFKTITPARISISVARLLCVWSMERGSTPQRPVPVLGVPTEQWGEHDHLVLACDHLRDGKDFVFRLWVADIQHGGGARLVLLQHAGRSIAHLHRVVGGQLTLQVLGGHLGESGKDR